MARKPARKSARSAAAAPTTDREKIIAAFLALLAEKRFEQIGFVDVAEGAGLPLAQLRGEFGSTLAILAAHIKAIDRAVLAEDFGDMADESPRERLFDVLMRRLEMLSPHRQAVRSLMRSASRNPALALALNALAVRSQQWMLAAAGIGAAGPRGMMRAQGLALCSVRCCAAGSMTRIRDCRAPWRRSTGRWRAASALPACSTTFAACPSGCAGCARGGAGTRRIPRNPPRPSALAAAAQASSGCKIRNSIKRYFFFARYYRLR